MDIELAQALKEIADLKAQIEKMEFDKSKVYTMLNADELKVGSKVIVGDNLLELKECVLKHRLPKIIKKVESEDNEHRFLCTDDFHYALAYLVSEQKEMMRR